MKANSNSNSWSEGLKLAPDKLEISEYFGSRAEYNIKVKK